MTADRDPVDLAARALRHRDRSRREIDDRLARAGVGDEERADALERLERVGYVDDARFAAGRASSLAERGYGDAAIRHDLAGHRLEPEAVEEAIGALVPEADRARTLALRLGRTPKTAAHLARKGFDADAIETAIGADIAESGA